MLRNYHFTPLLLSPPLSVPLCEFLSCVSHGQENIFYLHEEIHVTPPIDFLLAMTCVCYVCVCVLVKGVCFSTT